MMATINKILKRLRPRRKKPFVGYTTGSASYVFIGQPSLTGTTARTSWTVGVQSPTGATGVQGPTGPQGWHPGPYAYIYDEVELPSLPLTKPSESELPDGMVGLCWEEPLPTVIDSEYLGRFCTVKVEKGQHCRWYLVPFGTMWVDREVPA